jgi:hypothetical protein
MLLRVLENPSNLLLNLFLWTQQAAENLPSKRLKNADLYITCFESAFICTMISLIFEQKYNIANALSKQAIYNRLKSLDFYLHIFQINGANYTKSHFGLSKWLREHALWQPLPGRQ